MFTGLIEERGILKGLTPLAGGRRLVIGCTKVLEGMAVGDSLAVNGVCQTVTAFGSGWVSVEAVGDTLVKTTLGSWVPGTSLNLERACRADTRLGGHFVLGHVAGTGTVLDWSDRGAAWNLEVSLEPSLRKYVAAEGSVAVDGISLTVAGLTGGGFRVSVIPHTRGATTLETLRRGSAVNLEADILAKYVETVLAPASRGLDTEILHRWGYR